MLPHYNSRATMLLVVNEGEGQLELVGRPTNEQQEEEERSGQVQRYSARVSDGDLVVIPSSYPVAINASSSLNLLAFGINAENNRRNFLAGIDIKIKLIVLYIILL